MKKRYKTYLLLFLVLVLSFSLGYAYLNSTLYINGTSIINANVWDVELENLNITAGSIAAIEEPTVNNTETAFSVKLANQDDFYEFTVDVVNNGDVDAKLGNLVETTGLTEEQEQYFDYTLTYQNNEPIQVNQLVKKDEFVRLKSKVEYKDTVIATSVPESVKTLNLGFKLNYDLDDGTGTKIENNGRIFKVISGDGTNIGDEICIDNECFYVISSNETTITMLTKMNITTGENPVQSIDAPKIDFSENYYIGNPGTYVYDNYLPMYSYIENYKVYLKKISNIFFKARLIKLEELENLGCQRGNVLCTNTPNWVYSTSYWTGTSFEYDADNAIVHYVNENGGFAYTGIKNPQGIRPVIEFSKNALIDKNELKNFYIDNTLYKYEEGMTWEEWIDSEYNTGGYVINSYSYISHCDDINETSWIMYSYTEYGAYVNSSSIIIPTKYNITACPFQ